MSAAPILAQAADSLALLFLKIAASRRDAMAVLSSRGSLTYGTLLRRAVGVAQALRRHGVARGVLVGIILPRSIDALVAVYGTMLAGGVYVPIDPEYPAERQRLLLSESEVSVVVVAHSMAAPLCDLTHCSVVDLDTLRDEPEYPEFVPADSRDDDLLYVLYTSGSSGRPKGVCGPIGATLNRLHWGFVTFPFATDQKEVVAHRSSLNFVDSVVEIFSGILAGVPTVVFHSAETNDLGPLISALHRFAVTRLTVVPSVLAALLRAAPDLEGALPQLRLWTSSGEALPLPLLRQFRAAYKSATLINVYGSTEVTADVAYAVFPPDVPLPAERVPIGSPMADAELLVLDEHMAAVAPGTSGELYVGGPVLSRGYLRCPTEEAERFVADPRHPGQRLFRTGDRVQRGSDGLLYFLGRQDNQVKLRGVRIELEEIERMLAAEGAGLRELAVVVKEEPENPLSRRLCAFYSPADLDPETLRAAAHKLLPASMVPTEFLPITAMPLLPNGKLDRRALTQLAQSIVRDLRSEQQPQTETEQRLAAHFAAVLGQGSIARQDNLADLGGNSLALAELLFTLKRDFRSSLLSSAHIYRYPLHQLAAWIDAGAAPMSSADSIAGFEILPLTTLDAERAILLAAETDAGREPLTVATGMSLEDQIPFVTPIVIASLAEGMSFVARAQGLDQPLGFCLAHDFCSAVGIPIETAPPGLRATVTLLTEIEQDYVHLRGQPAKGEVVMLSMTGTSPEVQGYELSLQLERHTLNAAQRLGFRRAITICTSRVSTIQAELVGFQRLSSRSYSTYEFEGQRVFAGVADIHREAVLLIKDLS